LAYWALRRLLELVVLCSRSEREKEIEILLLRHQLLLLKRQVGRPQLRPADRALLTAFSRRLPQGVAIVLHHAGDAAAVAPRVGRTPVDLPGPASWSSRHGGRSV
jgi:hypothetical protein